MGLLTSLLSPRAATLNPMDDRYFGTGSVATAAGVRVTPDTALKVSAVWACAGIISDTIAALPLQVFQRQADGGRTVALTMPLYDLLHDQPNNLQTALEFKQLLTLHALLRGNGYAQIVPGPRGPVDQLIPIHPDRVTIERLPGGGVRYQVRQADGTNKPINDADMFHLRGLSLDGVTGVSVIEYARESVGLGLAAESYGARVFSQNARPGGVLKVPGELSDKAAQRLRTEWQLLHGGLNNAHQVAVLQEGADWEQTSMTSEDAQYLQTREFQAEDVARWFRVPPHMIGLTSKSTSWGTGIEQQTLGFLMFTLLPWLKRWEQAVSRDLIIATQTFYAEFVVDSLLRGDAASRNASYTAGRQGGWLTVNEIRQMENRNPVQGGDTIAPLTAPATQSAPAPGTQRGALLASHYRAFVADAAERIVHKEMTVMTKAARRTAADPATWRQAVEEFYADHAADVAAALHIGQVDAEHYCADQRTALLIGGAGVMSDWQPRRANDLAALTLNTFEEAHHAV